MKGGLGGKGETEFGIASAMLLDGRGADAAEKLQEFQHLLARSVVPKKASSTAVVVFVNHTSCSTPVLPVHIQQPLWEGGWAVGMGRTRALGQSGRTCGK